jgi:DNA-binding response OmpR family regulator
MRQSDMYHLLIVEDDPSMAVALKDGFEYEGYRVTLETDGEAALSTFEAEPPDLLVLDIMLPVKSGLDVCLEVRSRGSAVPILMLTARAEEVDKVRGLKLGADDYVTKPFSFLELIARVEALLRRSTGGLVCEGVHRVGDLEIDFRKREIRRRGAEISLTPRELNLLRYFVRHPGEAVSRDTLLKAVWGYDPGLLTRTVDMHVAKLRSKIEDEPADPRIIVTVHRVGYMFSG